ncbi:hypothetical protein FH972_013822 [Carpinus fangiana]|uniref:Uncharacterized protein n=1 Tax=Carpinus fangiana TaxID=176857 RepID=A0A5N6RAG4_9ROSI|nr:hypothetical protein FH972_013822 [Carpinus fangiana]
MDEDPMTKDAGAEDPMAEGPIRGYYGRICYPRILSEDPMAEYAIRGYYGRICYPMAEYAIRG